VKAKEENLIGKRGKSICSN